jgi:hypothetical protein
MTLMYIQDDLTIRAKYCLSDNGGLVPGIDGCCFEASHIHTQDLTGCHSSNTPIVADPRSICLARRLRCLVTPSYLYLGIAPRVVSGQFRSKQYPTRVTTQKKWYAFHDTTKTLTDMRRPKCFRGYFCWQQLRSHQRWILRLPKDHT